LKNANLISRQDKNLFDGTRPKRRAAITAQSYNILHLFALKMSTELGIIANILMPYPMVPSVTKSSTE